MQENELFGLDAPDFAADYLDLKNLLAQYRRQYRSTKRRLRIHEIQLQAAQEFGNKQRTRQIEHTIEDTALTLQMITESGEAVSEMLEETRQHLTEDEIAELDNLE